MKTVVYAVKEGSGPELVIEILQERILIGSGAHCDIRLPREAASFEHVIVTQEDGAVIARSVRAGDDPVIDGRARREAALEAGTTMAIGNVAIRIASVVENDAKEKPTGRAKRVAFGAVAVALAVTLSLLFRTLLSEAEEKVPLAPDPLKPPSTAACPETRGALPLAHQKLELGYSKEQRFRFYARDGVEAVASYETAVACFRAGKDARAAEDAEHRARFMRRQVLDAFHASRVRLDRALVRKDAATALDQVRFQRDLLSGNEQADLYVAWLAILQGKLESTLSKER